MIDDMESLKRDGHSAYQQGRYAEAALFFARARHSSEELRDHTSAFQAGVWEVECLHSGGRYEQAINLLLTLLAEPRADVPKYERWIAQKKVFEIAASTRPVLDRLQQALDDVSTLAREQVHPADDLALLEGLFNEYQGKWTEALQHYEQAWISKDDRVHEGYIPSMIAYRAALMALKLNRLTDAQAWRNHLAQTDQVEWESARQELQTVNAHLALYTSDPAALCECRDVGSGTDHLEAYLHLNLRGDSRQQHDDPREPFHPARALLRKRPIDPKNVHIQYDYRLSVVDYHLSSLRYAVGLPAIDDYYYQHPDMIPSSRDASNPQDFTDRLRSFDKAWCRLYRHARWLDGLLQCDYRTKESESRRERRDAIARTVA